jgi:hypothetical protein
MVIHVWLAASAHDSRGAFDHDEVITHLAVSGHLDDWQRVVSGDPPRGRWTSGEDVRSFLELDGESSLAEVRANLSDLDIHPPLYFWAVNVARSAGLGLYRSGPAVNLVASVLTGALLYAMVSNVVRRRVAAAIAVAGFAVSPALLFSVSLARQYVFLMLATTALLWTTARLLRASRSPVFLSCLAAVTAGGLLSANQFAYSLLGALLLLAAVAVRRRDVWAVVAPTAAAVAGGLVALAMHPGVGTQISRLDTRTAGFDASRVPSRLGDVLRGLFDLITLEEAGDRMLAPIALLICATLVATFSRWRQHAWDAMRRSPELTAAAGIGGVTLFMTALVYTLGRAPDHAVGRHYVIVFLPPLVVIATAVASRAARPALVLAAGVALVGAYAWQWNDTYESAWRHQRLAVDAVQNTALVVADCPLRGYAPGVAMWVPRNAYFLLTPAGDAAYPPLPPGADTSGAVLAHGNPRECRGVGDAVIDRRLAELGFSRGALVGNIGKVRILRLEPLGDRVPPVETDARSAGTQIAARDHAGR